MTDANRETLPQTTFIRGSGNHDGSPTAVHDRLDELSASAFRSSESYERRRLVGSLKETTADDVQFDESCFSAVDLSKTQWHKLLLQRTLLEKCDLANARWTNPNLRGVEFRKCRGTGLQFLDLRSSHSNFSNSKLNLAAFHGSKFRGDRFENCDLREANFEGVEFVDVVFRNCDLRQARFPKCQLRNVDFRGSNLGGIQIDPNNIRGACVDAGQLVDLATTFGLVVKPIGDDEK